MTRTSGRARKPGPRGDLSVPLVLAAATAVLERDGMDAFSLRGVARELGVAPNALYTYARSRDALLEEVADAALEHLDLTLLSPDGASPSPGTPRADPDEDQEAARRRVVDFAAHVLAEFRAHPAIARVLFDRPIGGPGAYRLNEALIGAIHRCGPSVPVSARIAYALTALVFGHAIIEVTDDARTRWPPLPDPATSPLSVAGAEPVPEIEDVFRWSVENLLIGCGC